jgi:hypothetical protein
MPSFKSVSQFCNLWQRWPDFGAGQHFARLAKTRWIAKCFYEGPPIFQALSIRLPFCGRQRC